MPFLNVFAEDVERPLLSNALKLLIEVVVNTIDAFAFMFEWVLETDVKVVDVGDEGLVGSWMNVVS